MNKLSLEAAGDSYLNTVCHNSFVSSVINAFKKTKIPPQKIDFVLLHRILIPRLFSCMQSADIDFRVTTLCDVFSFWLPERNEQHPLLVNTGTCASVFVCLSVLMAVRRITLITVTTVNVIVYN